MNGNTAAGDLVLIQISPLFSVIHVVFMLTSPYSHAKSRGLDQYKVTSSLASTRRPGHSPQNCKMGFVLAFGASRCLSNGNMPV